MVTSDHATPVEIKTHTDEAVPYFIYDSTKEVESGLERFSERGAGEKSTRNFEKGWELLPYFIKGS
jgi:2,3-bisphosphoglycerate-independent phosphoglycerate mutase